MIPPLVLREAVSAGLWMHPPPTMGLPVMSVEWGFDAPSGTGTQVAPPHDGPSECTWSLRGLPDSSTMCACWQPSDQVHQNVALLLLPHDLFHPLIADAIDYLLHSMKQPLPLVSSHWFVICLSSEWCHRYISHLPCSLVL